MADPKWVRFDTVREAFDTVDDQISDRQIYRIAHEDKWNSREDQKRRTLYDLNQVRKSILNRQKSPPKPGPKPGKPRLKTIKPLEH